MKISNKEKQKDFDINISLDRESGVSSMMRVGDEEEFIEASIMSTIDFFDEITIVLNNSKDNTENIVRSIDSDKIKIYHYPFKLRPNGPGHKNNNPEDSAFSISYYYNWCMSKTTKSHICKWDGDNVALHDFNQYRDLILSHDVVWFKGINIVGKNLDLISKHSPFTGLHPSFHVVNKNTRYLTGDSCEILNHQHVGPKHYEIDNPIFLHYKACKSESMQTRMWPDNWRELPHFQNIYKRFHDGTPYNGKQPREIKKILKQR